MPSFRDVDTGDVVAASGDVTLVANAIGSCVVCGVYDPLLRAGGMAHIMLPGWSPTSFGASRFRFAGNGIGELLRRMDEMGYRRGDLRGFCAGGGNVLQRHDDTICSENISSCLGLLEHHGLRVVASSLGGDSRRRVVLELPAGRARCAVGDGPFRLLCDLGTAPDAQGLGAATHSPEVGYAPAVG